MRDPKRIESILTKLKTIWEANPDMRLGQLLENLEPLIHSRTFFVEDDTMEKALDHYISTGKWPA